MTGDHSDLGADLMALAETVLTRLEPILRSAAAQQSERTAQGCTWCPVCALAALVRGEQHDLLDMITSEGTLVIAALRQMLADHTARGQAERPAQDGAAADRQTEGSTPHEPSEVPDEPDAHALRHGAFVPIDVQIRDRPPRP